LALALLKRGDYERGWRELESRFAVPPQSIVSFIHYSFPAWRGEPLECKTIFLYTEQGFGDTIQMARYVPLVAARGPARIILACRPAMSRLLASLAGVDETVTDLSTAIPKFDVQCPFMSLPLALGTTTPAAIPSQVPYLSPPEDLVETWRQKLSPHRGTKGGLAWAGSPTNTNNRYRSCGSDDLPPSL